MADNIVVAAFGETSLSVFSERFLNSLPATTFHESRQREINGNLKIAFFDINERRKEGTGLTLWSWLSLGDNRDDRLELNGFQP